MSAKSRAFSFTLNNYDESQIDAIKHIDARYICYGKEVAPSTGTPHLQGYIYFRSARGLKSAIALLPRGTHVEISRFSAKQNADYCKKDGDFFELGDRPLDAGEKGAAEAERWTRITALARLGDFEQILTEYPDVYATRLKTIEYLHLKRPRSLDPLQGDGPFHQWIVGPTGCGKSRRARADNPGAFIKEPECKWWDNYDGQDVAIIDDFDKFQVSQGGQMKRWLDRYPFPAEVKGGMIDIRPKKIVVTSQYTPAEIWDDERTVDAIMRRVELVDMRPPTVPGMFVSTFKVTK